MANILYNIKQLTNFDIQDYEVSSKHKIFNNDDSEEISYAKFNFLQSVTKLGYCCETRAIGYPIILYFEDGTNSEFEIGKTGMFEMQIETFVNNDIEIKVIAVEVPKDYNFVIDYAYAV